MSEVETVDKDTINKFNNDIGALIVDVAEKTCGTFTISKLLLFLVFITLHSVYTLGFLHNLLDIKVVLSYVKK